VKPPPFDYVQAGSLAEALAALEEGGTDAKPIAGGQSLVPAMTMRLVRPSVLVDLNRAGLAGMAANGALRIGATTRQAALAGDKAVHPLVRRALPFVGHFVTRNRGTVGGSIAHADGAAELPLCLVALDGVVVAEGPDGRREIPAEEFFVTHFLTTLRPGELVVETTWPLEADGESSAFEELALRSGDFAQSMVAKEPSWRRRGSRSARSPIGRLGCARWNTSSSERVATPPPRTRVHSQRASSTPRPPRTHLRATCGR
jgi:CO/xanthine dehydrogenase FAD-binding subunit